MAQAAPIFYGEVVNYINLVLWVFCLVIGAAGLLHCLVQRGEAFAAIGTLSKTAWLALNGGGLLITAVTPYLFNSVLNIFPLIAVGIAAVYLLDVRPALREATDGRGSW
jgi:hypothetical protein